MSKKAVLVILDGFGIAPPTAGNAIAQAKKPNLDKLFDNGFISFADDGAVIISPVLSSAARAAFGVDAAMHLLKPLNAAQQTYMAYHRDHVFKKG